MYYKVVTQDLQSLIHHNSILSVQYKVDEWVYPHIEHSSLMCCDSLEYAKFWQSQYSGRIFECKVILSENPIFIYEGNMFADVVYRKLSQLIKKSLGTEECFYINEICNMSPYSRMCDAIKLVKEVI